METINGQNCFAKFHFFAFATRSGRPVGAGEDKIKALIETNHRITTHAITEILNRLNPIILDKIFTYSPLAKKKKVKFLSESPNNRHSSCESAYQ